MFIINCTSLKTIKYYKIAFFLSNVSNLHPDRANIIQTKILHSAILNHNFVHFPFYYILGLSDERRRFIQF